MKPVFIKSIPVNTDIDKYLGKDFVFQINEVQIQNNYLSALLDRESRLVYIYDISSTSSQPVAISNEHSPYKILYKTGFGQLLKYRILQNKYWFDMDFYQGPNTDIYRPELEAIGLDPERGIETKTIARITYGKEAFYERIMVEDNKIYAGWSIGDTQGNTDGIQLIVYSPKGGFSDRGNLELPEGGLNYFVQGNIIYTISGGNSLITYKVNH